MKHIMLNILLVSLFLLISGCQQKFDDISLSNEFNHLISTEYQSLQVLKLHGVTIDRNYEEKVDFYSLTDIPGISGPEIVVKRNLKIGSRIRVDKVLKCNNCFISSPVVLLVSVLTESITPNVPVRLYGAIIKDVYGDVMVLNPKIFKRLH